MTLISWTFASCPICLMAAVMWVCKYLSVTLRRRPFFYFARYLRGIRYKNEGECHRCSMNMDEECKMSMEYSVQTAINKITATKFKEVP